MSLMSSKEVRFQVSPKAFRLDGQITQRIRQGVPNHRAGDLRKLECLKCCDEYSVWDDGPNGDVGGRQLQRLSRSSRQGTLELCSALIWVAGLPVRHHLQSSSLNRLKLPAYHLYGLSIVVFPSCCIHRVEQPASWYSVILLLDWFLPQTRHTCSTDNFQTFYINYWYIDYASMECVMTPVI